MYIRFCVLKLANSAVYIKIKDGKEIPSFILYIAC